MNVYEKLNLIQVKLKAPKSQYNSFGKYKYRSCEDIQEAVKTLLKETKTILLLTDNIELIGDRYFVKATAQLVDTENIDTVSSVSVAAYAREPLTKKGMDEAQVTGATSSYARKYALNGLFNIDDTKDADTTNTHETSTTTTAKAPVKKAPTPQKENDISNSDLAIFKEMSQIDDMAELASFYKNNYKKVSDKEAFATLKDKKKEALSGK